LHHVVQKHHQAPGLPEPSTTRICLLQPAVVKSEPSGGNYSAGGDMDADVRGGEIGGGNYNDGALGNGSPPLARVKSASGSPKPTDRPRWGSTPAAAVAQVRKAVCSER